MYAAPPGSWVSEPASPSPHVRDVTYALQGAPALVRSPMHTRLDAGRFFPFGNDADLPPDQPEEDARSACFDFEVGEETWVLGRPKVRLRLTSEVRAGRSSLETYTIDESDPLSARARSEWSIRLHRPEPAWDTTVRTRSEISHEKGHFATPQRGQPHEGRRGSLPPNTGKTDPTDSRLKVSWRHCPICHSCAHQ